MEQTAITNIRKAAAPLRQQVLDALRQAIIAGRLAPGQRLTERELMAMTTVSRTVVREALRQLESEGLVAIIPNKGPIVHKLSLAEAQDLYRIRAVLEGLAARLFVEHADKADLKRLSRSFDAVAEAYSRGNVEHIVGTKNHFYDVLYSGACSPMLSDMLARLHARIWRWRALGLKHPNRSSRRSDESVRNLRAIVRAIKSRDADAAERIARVEADQAAAEVTRLLADPVPANPPPPVEKLQRNRRHAAFRTAY